MERDFAAELDAMKQQIDEMQAAMKNLLPELQAIAQKMMPEMPDCAKDGPKPTVGHVEKMVGMIPDQHLATELDRLENLCGTSGTSGRLTYLGVFASGGRQSTWMRNSVNADDLLSLIENRTAEKVLNCIGSNDKLSILLAILRQPRTVAELVSDCGFTSTGQVYHHLKPLLTADLVTQDKRGSYIIQSHRVQGLIMLLAGISDLVDPTYTQGNFAD